MKNLGSKKKLRKFLLEQREKKKQQKLKCKELEEKLRDLEDKLIDNGDFAGTVGLYFDRYKARDHLFEINLH